MFVKSLPAFNRDLTFNPFEILGSVYIHISVGKQKIQQVWLLVTRCGRSLMGHGWLATIKYEFTPATQSATRGGVCPNSASKVKRATQVEGRQIFSERLTSEFPELFKRRGRFRKMQIQNAFTPNLKVAQQKGRRVPVQLKESA